MKFLSKMFHPNIFEEDGQVGLDTHWSPAFGISTILVSIQSLLRDPNLISLPANKLAGQLLRENKREYLKRVKLCVELSWSDDLTMEGEWDPVQGISNLNIC